MIRNRATEPPHGGETAACAACDAPLSGRFCAVHHAALARFRDGMAQVLSFVEHEPPVATPGTIMSRYIAARAGVAAAPPWEQLSMPCFVCLDRETGSFEGVVHLAEDNDETPDPAGPGQPA